MGSWGEKASIEVRILILRACSISCVYIILMVSWSSRMIDFRCILTSSQTMGFGDPPLKKLVFQKWGHLGDTVDGWNPAFTNWGWPVVSSHDLHHNFFVHPKGGWEWDFWTINESTVYGCFLEWWYPHVTPQVLIIFSRKTHGIMVVGYPYFRKPPKVYISGCVDLSLCQGCQGCHGLLLKDTRHRRGPKFSGLEAFA